MSEMRTSVTTKGQTRMSPELLRSARNHTIGMLAFRDGEPSPDTYADTHEVLQALGLAWKTPPADVVLIGRLIQPDALADRYNP